MGLSDLKVNRVQVDAVFAAVMLSKYRQCTKMAYPHSDELPLNAQGALVSLIFNRGTSMGKVNQPADWERRREMRAIQVTLADDVQRGDLAAVATPLRAMKRLWMGKRMDGLITDGRTRRLVERSGRSMRVFTPLFDVPQIATEA